jgi:hypothetical protein
VGENANEEGSERRGAALAGTSSNVDTGGDGEDGIKVDGLNLNLRDQHVVLNVTR